MLSLYVGESRDHVAITDTKDCIPCDVVRINTRLFVGDPDVIECAKAYKRRGFKVSVQYEHHGVDVEYFTDDIEVSQ